MIHPEQPHNVPLIHNIFSVLAHPLFWGSLEMLIPSDCLQPSFRPYEARAFCSLEGLNNAADKNEPSYNKPQQKGTIKPIFVHSPNTRAKHEESSRAAEGHFGCHEQPLLQGSIALWCSTAVVRSLRMRSGLWRTRPSLCHASPPRNSSLRFYNRQFIAA